MKFQFKLEGDGVTRGANDEARSITQKLNSLSNDKEFESEEKAREWAEPIIRSEIYMVFDRWHFDKLEVTEVK